MGYWPLEVSSAPRRSEAARRPFRGYRTPFMSWLQKLFVGILPRRWGESMEAESRSWMMRCSCGFARSVWELGGIRWKAEGKPWTFSFMKCPQCRKRSWHKLTRDAP